VDMKQRDAHSVIRKLIREKARKDRADEPVPDGENELTTLGIPLIRIREGHVAIDLTSIRVFRNLHGVAQLLVNEVLEQCGFGAADIMVKRKTDPNLTPELAEAGVDWIVVYARLDAAESLPFYHHFFGACMRAIFRTFQTERWGGVLFPDFFGHTAETEKQQPRPALLFPFHLRGDPCEGGQYFLVEYNPSGRFLRISIEAADASRLQLKHIAHRVVDQHVQETFLADVYRIAEQVHQGILRECLNKRSEYTEISVHQQDLFDNLRRGGLKNLDNIRFSWSTDDIEMMLIEKTESGEKISPSLNMLVKEIQLLEDPSVLSHLARGELVEMISGRFHVYFDVSRYGTCLNVSFERKRTVLALGDYLADMPSLSLAVQQRKGLMHGVRLFLIHHITAEVIGLLKAYQDAGCCSITTFFVQYGGVVPDDYLETLMSLSPEFFRFYGLQRMESLDRLGGRYAFSRRFTALAGLEKIDEKIFQEAGNFFSAMRLAAGHLFLTEASRAIKEGQRLLLVEDGGYLSPILNRFCLTRRTVSDVFAEFDLAVPEGEGGLSFSVWLEQCLAGGVEHTRNGYDYNAEVMESFGTFWFPVVSIAVSRLKRGSEARECAVSILNAVENVLHRVGKSLSGRHALVLGSSGAIGRFLVRDLIHRIGSDRVFGVDIAAAGESASQIVEVRTMEGLGPEVLHRIDMVIGVVGKSVLDEKSLEDMILNSRQKNIFFASGSTKTVEFEDMEQWLQSLRKGGDFRLGGNPVRVEFSALRDLQTGILQGYRVDVAFEGDPAKSKVLYLLGELMPINFLYYGIPREIVDDVMAQLFCVSCGLIDGKMRGEVLPPRLLAVDLDIDADARILSKK